MLADVSNPIRVTLLVNIFIFYSFPFRIVCVGVAKVYQFLITTKSFLKIFILSNNSFKLIVSTPYSLLIII
jgi:hypothetical protein